MKKAISTKNEKRTGRSRQSVEVAPEAMKILRTVKDGEAFYFYEAVGKPTGEVARNLSDLLDKVQLAKSESLLFHAQRGDFRNWVEQVLGDSKLARKLGKISASNSDDVRRSICRTVKNRIRELSEASMAVMVDVNNAVLVPCS
jgi:hypothetical protein